MAMRKPGVYVALSANYADDEAIMDAGEDAELMYVRMLAYAARTPLTEGWISDRVILSRLGIIARAAGNGAGNVAGTDAGSRAGVLCTVGLIHRDGEGYRITSWLKWNRSVEEMGREKSRDAGRKKPVTSDDDGTDAGNVAGNGAGLPAASPLSDQNTYTDQNAGQIKAARAAEFDAFWAAYPRKDDKGHARPAWTKALTKADAETITAGASRLAADPNLEKKFIPLPATWLNGERWGDGPLPTRTDTPANAPAARSPWDNKVQHIGSAA